MIAGPSSSSFASVNTNTAVSTTTSLFASLNNIVGVGSGGSDAKESAGYNANQAGNANDLDGKKEEDVPMIDELFPYNPGMPLYTSTLGTKDGRGIILED